MADGVGGGCEAYRRSRRRVDDPAGTAAAGAGVAREAAGCAFVSPDSGEKRGKGSESGSVDAAAIRSSRPRAATGDEGAF